MATSTVSSRLFDWNPAKRLFVEEMSTLQASANFDLRQIYPDACDAGFTMVSARTGREVDFVMCSTDRSGGEVQGWRFEPTRDSIRRDPACAGLSVLIIND